MARDGWNASDSLADKAAEIDVLLSARTERISGKSERLASRRAQRARNERLSGDRESASIGKMRALRREIIVLVSQQQRRAIMIIEQSRSLSLACSASR